MKHLFFTMLISGVFAVLSLGSCKKENLSVVPIITNPVPPPTTTDTLELVAGQWVYYFNEIYVDDFPGVLATINPGGNRKVFVYLEKNEGEIRSEIQINNSDVMFGGHELWATCTGDDLKINYLCGNAPRPFDYLIIKLVVQ